MATAVQLRKLMAVTCPWCRSAPGEECVVASGRQGKPRPKITSLDGGCHDARWRVAMGEEAPVVLPEAPTPVSVSPGAAAAAGDDTREPVPVGATVGSVFAERPW